MKYKRIYNSMPITIQTVMTSIYGKKIAQERYSKAYKDYLNFLRSNFFSMNHYEYQKKSLNEFLKYCSENSVYYKGILPNEILPLNEIEDLEKIKILTKEDVRANINNLITKSKRDMISSFTGGTTGKSLNVFFEKEDFEKRIAFLDFFKERHGVLKGMRRASFTGKDMIPEKQKKKVYWRYNWPLKQMLFSSFHLTEENIPYYINELNKFQPQSMDGFPSVMVTLAKYIIRNNIKLKFKPIAIFPTAETITDYDREVIEQAFKSKVRNQYASSEGAPFITECPNGNLHLDIMTGVFEKVNKTSAVSEIYVTAFETKGTPLIRYKIGDVLEFTDDRCSCGYDTPIIKQIIGRNMDFLYSKERGKISSANMSNTIKNLPNSIVNIQFIQDKENEIKIIAVKDHSLFKEKHEVDLMREMKIRLGSLVNYDLQYVDDIPVESSGKYKMIKSSIQNQIEI